MSRRYVTDPLAELPNPEERFRLYTLCVCSACDGMGKETKPLSGDTLGRVVALGRCPECRGEGRVREQLDAYGSPEELGAGLVEHGRARHFDDEDGFPCPIGIYDAVERKWLVLPWLPSARNLTDAGRALGKQSARKRKAENR